MPRQPNTSPQTLALYRFLLDDAAAWRHGYEISKATGLKSGTLYPMLARLERQSLLDTRWEESSVAGRPPRHLYRLSEAGLGAAQYAVAGVPRQILAARNQHLQPEGLIS